MKLLTPYKMGDLELANRVVMAPLTRNRAGHDGDAPLPIAQDYYRQRSSAGLIIAEASQISREGQGYSFTPGIYTQKQIEGWRGVTSAVHEAGGKIFLQLWHVGRISHSALQEGGKAPVAPSALAAKTKVFVKTGFVETSEPRALETSEIARIVADYAQATKNARAAGFDGVEIHAANGYLIEQFLKDGTNKRTDSYGGSIENRCRFALAVIDAVVGAWDADHVGIRLSPVSPANDITDSDPAPLYAYLTDKINAAGLVYIHVIEGATGGKRDIAPFGYRALRDAFRGTYIANNGYDRDLAERAVEAGDADLVAFGRPFIANPDLVGRLRINAPLAEIRKETLYGGGAAGYTDYPALG